MKIFLILVGLIAAVTLWTISHAAEFNPAWEDDMLTQEELEELANALWESDDDDES